MKDITKYVMGEASKSNVEKRQVGCVIVGGTSIDEEIVAVGHNIEGQHAEAMACENFVANAVERQQYEYFDVYVSHPPCPECAKLLADHGFTNVEVIEAFQKFDGDKLRYDLIDGDFISKCFDNLQGTSAAAYNISDIRELLWSYQSYPKPIVGRVNYLQSAVGRVYDYYACFNSFEEALARVLTFGARKYKANNWKKCEDTGRYLAAAHRHLIAKISGEECDPETGFDHMDHVITNLMFLYVLGYTNE